MDNKVTHVLARAMMECGAPAFRFNFRGVGASAGTFDNGRGETDDLAAVVAEGRRRFPGCGTVVRRLLVRRLRGAARRERPCARRSWWPWRRRWRASSSAAWRIRIATGCWSRATPTTWCRPRRCWRGPRNSHVKPRLHVLAGAGHFFHGKLHELKPLLILGLSANRVAEKHKSPDVFRRRAFVAASARRGTREA